MSAARFVPALRQVRLCCRAGFWRVSNPGVPPPPRLHHPMRLPLTRQALRQPIARAAVAGPSTLRAPFLARAATTAASNASGASGDAASAAAAAAAAQGQSAPEADSIHSHEAEESALPSNLSFEDLSGARKQVSASLDGRGGEYCLVREAGVPGTDRRRPAGAAECRR